VAQPGWGSLPDDVAADVRRLADRLRGLSQARLAAPVPPHASRADAARAASQRLAEAAQGLAARDDPAEPGWRVLPSLGDFAVGDQVAVTGHDLLAELATCDPDAQVWAPPATGELTGTRRPALDVVAAAAETLAATRRLL
jgi:hypothetical protein